MDLSLNQKQIELIELVQELVRDEIRPYYLKLKYQEEAPFDWYLIELLGKYNLMCPTIPEEYGGMGLDYFTTALLIEEIATGCPGLAAIMDTNLHAVTPILLAGTREQKEQYLPKLTGAQPSLASFALTESTGGSDIASMHTIAIKKDDGFILNGAKDYILNAPQASFISVFAMTDPIEKKSSLRAFIVSSDTPGVQIGQRRHMAGLEYAQLAEVIFKNAIINSELVIKKDETCSGYLLLSQTFDIGRAMVGATSVGIARAAYEEALDFADNRIQYGTSIRKQQAVSFALADMATRIEAARLMTWKACWLIDQGGDYTIASSMAKYMASTIAQKVTAAAADILAARAHERNSLLDKLTRDAKILSTVEGTNNIQKNIIASLL